MLTYKRFHTEKRKWNSYPNKNFKTYKVYEIILNIKVGESMIKKLPWNCSRLEPLRFYGLIVFVSKKAFVLSNPSWYFVLFCSVFYCYFDFSKQLSTKDNNEKKSHGRRNETTRYLRLKTCRKFPQKREHQTSTSLRASSLFWGSREKSRHSSTHKVTRVRGTVWEARSLAIHFARN